MPRIPSKLASLKLQNSNTWSELTNAQLHRIAVLIGSPCSGTKSVRISGIEKALAGPSDDGFKPEKLFRPISLVSIDMGIRNLAYAHFMASRSVHVNADNLGAKYIKPCLEAWERLSIAPLFKPDAPSEPLRRSKTSTSQEETTVEVPESAVHSIPATKESFEPAEYARYAYNLIDRIIAKHQPTHILIERQRFRSGGGSAVQEWTIRVGVFEGMLYAVLKTLAEERGISLTVKGVLPTRINRYWFEEGFEKTRIPPERRLSGKEVKKAKIDMVASMLSAVAEKDLRFQLGAHAEDAAGGFLTRAEPSSKKLKDKGPNVKLDDLADCLLQGLAWIEWQTNIQRVKTLGADGLMCHELPSE